MALKLKGKKEVTIDGAEFIIEIYVSDITGKESVVKRTKPSDIAPESELESTPTDAETAQSKLDYIIMMEGGK